MTYILISTRDGQIRHQNRHKGLLRQRTKAKIKQWRHGTHKLKREEKQFKFVPSMVNVRVLCCVGVLYWGGVAYNFGVGRWLTIASGTHHHSAHVQ